jgi:RNA polymerase sigma-70 factor
MSASVLAAYIDALPIGAPGVDHAELSATLVQLCGRGARAYPDLVLAAETFARHLAVCGARIRLGPDAIDAGDLWLACAALNRTPTALDRLREYARPGITAYLRPLRLSDEVSGEVTQRLWESLLVGDGTRPPTLTAYAGRGPVRGFIGTTAQRIAFRELGQVEAQRRMLTKAADVVDSELDPELAIIREKYRPLFQAAVTGAFGQLDDHERMILRMQTVDGMTVDEIARIYRVSQSTISRHLAKARTKIVAQCRATLADRLGISKGEFESLFNLFASQIDVSISHVLAAAD